MQEVLRPDILEQDLVLIVVKKDLKIFRAADPVMMRAFRANKNIFPQLRNGTDVIAVGALRPKTFRCFLLFRGTRQNAFFDASEPTALALLTLSLISRQVGFKIVVMFHGLLFADFGGKDTKERPFMAILSY